MSKKDLAELVAENLNDMNIGAKVYHREATDEKPEALYINLRGGYGVDANVNMSGGKPNLYVGENLEEGKTRKGKPIPAIRTELSGYVALALVKAGYDVNDAIQSLGIKNTYDSYAPYEPKEKTKAPAADTPKQQAKP